MERVQNLSQFLHWLKERKLRKQEVSADRKCRNKEEVVSAHASGCKCRRCMRLPQLPREHRRQQQSLRSGESPEHVYEEIPPELVSSDPEQTNCVDPITSTGPKQCGKATNCEKQSAKCSKDTVKDRSTTARINELFRANAKAQVMTSSNKDPPAAQQDSSVNLGNLDFGQAKEFGGFLVVPLRDRMVFQPVLEGDTSKYIPAEQETKTPDNHSPKNLNEFREVLKEHVKHQGRNSLPKRLHRKDMAEVITSEQNIQIDQESQDKFIKRDNPFVQQAKSVPDLTADQTDKQGDNEPETPVKTGTRKPRHSNSKSAFTRYIPTTSATTSNGIQYDARTISTDTSEDSGGYFNADGVAGSPPESSGAQSSGEPQGSSSDRSNDTYNEYDCKSEASSNDYDVFLQKAQQVRGFESNIQAIVREAEYAGSCSSSGKSSCSSPLSILDMDDILALVSSDDHSELLNDIMFSPHPQNTALLKQRLSHHQHTFFGSTPASAQHEASHSHSHSHGRARHNSQESSLKHKQPPGPLPSENPNNAAHVGSSHGPPPVPPKISCRVTAGPARRVAKVGASNRLLADLMRANHDRQLLY